MILKPYKGKWPQIHPNAWIAENATIIGDVTIEEHASIWYGAVLRADICPSGLVKIPTSRTWCSAMATEMPRW